MGRAHKKLKPQQKKAGANVSNILGHFQKCLTPNYRKVLDNVVTGYGWTVTQCLAQFLFYLASVKQVHSEIKENIVRPF